MSIEANYEIIRFIEHGKRCRPAMDCIPGELLIYRVRQCTVIEKETLFEWMRELLQQLEQFQRCKNNQGYRYVNPYSVLVTRENNLMLLDLEAESNAFVLRNLQKRAMRNHFVKPVVHIRENTKVTLDLYGYGKTIQFILANTEVEPSLSKWEENRIAKLIDRCLGENSKKVYESFGQVWHDLPVIRKKTAEKAPRRKEWIFLSGIMAILLILAGWNLYRMREDKVQMYKQVSQLEKKLEVAEAAQEEERKKAKEQQMKAEAELPEEVDGMQILRENVDVFQEYLARNTTEDNREIILTGEILQQEVLRCLASAYEREMMSEQALETYAYLSKTETDAQKCKEYYMRRIALNGQQGSLEAAELLIKEAEEKFPEIKEDAEYNEIKKEYGLDTVKEVDTENAENVDNVDNTQ